jgi:hypothetical protein
MQKARAQDAGVQAVEGPMKLILPDEVSWRQRTSYTAELLLNAVVYDPFLYPLS